MAFDRRDFKIIVSFHLKSGTVLEAFCDDIEIKVLDSIIVSYYMKGLAKGHALYIRLDDISAITYKTNPVWKGQK